MAKAPLKKSNETSLSLETYPFHLLLDNRTEKYIKFAKVMVICQGSYSNARENSIELIGTKYKSTSRVLFDESYTTELRCKCEAETTEQYFEYFKEQVKNALEMGNNLIYVDMTLSHIKMNEYLCAAAYKSQYVVLIMPPIVTVRNVKSNWPRKSQASSFQDYSKHRVEAPNMFEHLFCAWFFHDLDTEELRNECALYCNDLFENIPEFGKWFSKVGDAEFFPKYFGLLQDDVKKEERIMREDIAFCSVKVFTSEFQMPEYFLKPEVRANYGKMSKIYIIGFIISPYIVAARVQLTHKQKEFWEMEDNINEEQYIEIFPSELYKESRNLPPPYPAIRRICSKSNVTVVKGKHSFEPSKLIPPNAKGRTCHIVLGTAPNAPAAEIDYGVAFAVKREAKAEDKKNKMEVEVIQLKNSEVKRIGKYWFIYLKDSLVVDGFFASCCKPCDFETPVKDIKFSKGIKQ